jgi:flagellar hook-associated protein 1 FlgK
MAGLFTTINTTSSALNAQTQAINITGNNIANVNSPNYSRQSADIEEVGSVETPDGPVSEGLTVATVQDSDAVLNQMVQQQAALTSGYQAQQSVYQQAQAALGENVTGTSSGSTGTTSSTATDSGLGEAIDDFFNAFDSLAANPNDSTANQALIEQAGVLTDRFQQISSNLSQVQANADATASAGVTQANSLLQQIATLNSQISSAELQSPGSSGTLQDQREGDLEQLAGLMPITVSENAQDEDTVSASASGGGSVTLIANGQVSNSLSYASGVVSAGSTTLSLASGSIQGAVAASTGGVQTLIDNLNALASQIVTSVNSAYNPGNTAGGNFFDSSGTTGGTIALDSGLTSATLQAGTSPGDNSLALAVAAIANQKFSTAGGDDVDGTLDQAYGNAVSQIGQAVDTANNQVTDQTYVQTIVQNQRASVSGVSLDEEMSNLLTYQQAYQASTEVFQVVDSMLNTLVSTLTSITG